MKRLVAQTAVLGVGALALIGLGAASNAIAGRDTLVTPLVAEDSASTVTALKGKLKSTQQELERAHQVLEYSGRYSIPADLSAAIYDNAIAAGIQPSLGFELVRLESGFKNTARSGMAAIGLTQLQLRTARAYDPDLAVSDLMNRDTNLRIGFSYLKDLLKRFDNDMALALEAYNKGPTLIAAQQEMGEDVIGKYSNAVMQGAKKKS
ncbi:MAG TPA: transglycosylase SLT domain-containing protein [Gemmatimonadales bacterium]|nr:transglycosylase SLT domain-containing protein [Gemmatimonadales bacterium]